MTEKTGDHEESRSCPSESAAGLGHGTRCRIIIGVAVRAFLSLAESAAEGGAVSLDELRHIARAVMGAEGALADCYNAHSAKCTAYFEMLACERKRINFFGRIITQPFCHLLDEHESGIERKNLPQFFAAVRMIVGEDHNLAYHDRSMAIANELRGDQPMLPWDDFYQDRRVLDILEEVQVAVARSFRHFEPRKDWFMVMMNTDPESVSLASNAFVTKNTDAKLSHGFGDAHFVRLFKELFASARPEHFDEARKRRFTETYGVGPNSVFGNVFVELTALEQAVHAPPPLARASGFETRKKQSKRKRP